MKNVILKNLQLIKSFFHFLFLFVYCIKVILNIHLKECIIYFKLILNYFFLIFVILLIINFGNIIVNCKFLIAYLNGI